MGKVALQKSQTFGDIICKNLIIESRSNEDKKSKEEINDQDIDFSSFIVQRSFNQDLFIKVEEDITDFKGSILYKAGSKIILFKGLKLASLVFINGTDLLQIKWALARKRHIPCTTIMLVKDSSNTLTNKYQFIEDEGNYFAEKFDIKHTPAIVKHKGDHINIREINIQLSRHNGK